MTAKASRTPAHGTLTVRVIRNGRRHRLLMSRNGDEQSRKPTRLVPGVHTRTTIALPIPQTRNTLADSELPAASTELHPGVSVLNSTVPFPLPFNTWSSSGGGIIWMRTS